ncbi:MAG: nucleotide exchange factor GrpE [Actinobacteria bacterium]|nr:nucleotide exchange factor GrpE [Actinomycetota bacterium]
MGTEPAPGDDTTPDDANIGAEAATADAPMTVEDLVALVESLTAERDAHLDARARLQADYDNHRKRVAAQQAELAERAAEALVAKLLPVLDACDAAAAHGVDGVAAVGTQLLGVLERDGLERVDAAEVPFDPTVHEAVMFEEGDGGPQIVAEVLRTGYRWNGRVVRAAMVRVRG